MDRKDLKVNRCYRGKHPAECNGYVNDRQIVWIGWNTLQYDGPAVRIGMRRPTVDIDKFLAWADRDVTDELPKGEWAPWNPNSRKAASAK